MLYEAEESALNEKKIELNKIEVIKEIKRLK